MADDLVIPKTHQVNRLFDNRLAGSSGQRLELLSEVVASEIGGKW
jgi:hypothetical protein